MGADAGAGDRGGGGRERLPLKEDEPGLHETMRHDSRRRKASGNSNFKLVRCSNVFCPLFIFYRDMIRQQLSEWLLTQKQITNSDGDP